MNELNKKALAFLTTQKWENAQQLLFENAKKSPCHMTFQNLGYYLFTEGLLCKTGKYRNAEYLGFQYLLKAAKSGISIENLCAIATAMDHFFYYPNRAFDLKSPLSIAYESIDAACKLWQSDALIYNRLYLSYLLTKKPKQAFILELSNRLSNSENKYTVRFYLYLLAQSQRINECIACMDRYGKYLDELDLFTLCFLCDQYNRCLALSDSLIKKYDLDSVTQSMVSNVYMWAGKQLPPAWESRNSLQSREEIILRFQFAPEFQPMCCYIDCPIHPNKGTLCIDNIDLQAETVYSYALNGNYTELADLLKP